MRLDHLLYQWWDDATVITTTAERSVEPAGPPARCCASWTRSTGFRGFTNRNLQQSEWADTYASYRNTIEGLNGYMKDPAHECLQAPGRRRVRGIAAQSVFAALLVTAANFRKISAHRRSIEDGLARNVPERARRRRTSLQDYKPPPST